MAQTAHKIAPAAPKHKLTWKFKEQNPLNLPTYNANPRIKRANVEQTFTAAEILEFRKCKNDREYFCKNYIKVIKPGAGLIDYEPYPYQIDMMDQFDKERFNIVLACRQSGKSVGFIGYVVWLALFHTDTLHIVIAANKLKTAKEMLLRIQRAFENLPFFLQMGCKELNKESITFDNDTKIECISASSDGARGKSADIMICDEFAFVEGADEFYESNYPLISSDTSGKTKMIIVSTPNGINNQFYTLWDNAVKTVNEFNPIRVDWWDVPGRDQAWADGTKSNMGEKKFAQEFGNSFNQTSSTLIDMEFLIGLSVESPLENSRDNLKFYEAPQDDHQYVMTVDVAKGRGIDYSTFSVIDITQTPMKQVATYRDNLVSPLSFPSLLYKIGKAYNDAYVIVEANAGEVVHKILQYDLEYENIYTSKVVNGRSLGLEMNKKVKRIGCSNLKDLIEQRQLVIPDEDTIRELCVFEAKGESFEARKNEHDDMVMTLVMFAWFADTNIFGYLGTDQLRTLMGDESKALSNSSTPFLGFLDEESANPIYENWDIDASDSSLWRFEEVNRGWDLGNRRKEDEYLF